MSHHPLADKIIAYSDKYLENAELMFLNLYITPNNTARIAIANVFLT